jgi:hypothetical protein
LKKITVKNGAQFSDQINFYVHGKVIQQNLRYWSKVNQQNQQWFSGSKVQGDKKLMVLLECCWSILFQWNHEWRNLCADAKRSVSWRQTRKSRAGWHPAALCTPSSITG